ncbi:MAG: ABC transporter permease subunit [Defluviitaleaceae bacterium]|nr:ABC transporter permease subunit [Defluviitaleaceae bacterium]
MKKGEADATGRDLNPGGRRRRIKTTVREYRQIYLFLLPAVVFFVLFAYLPMYGITMAFREFRFDKGLFFSPWIGFRYFRSFFNYYAFWQLIRNTVVISFFKIILYFPLPIIFALLLNEIKNNAFKRVVQTVSYLPYFLSWVVAYVIIQQFISLDNGLFNQVRVYFGLEKIFYANEANYFYPIMFISFIWKNIGYSSIIYLAALAGVDLQLYEAATIDGANRFRKMWHISLPSVAPIIIMLFILGLSSVLSAGWDQIYQLRQPGNMQIADILDTYVIKQGLRDGQFGYATAVSLFQSGIGLVLIVMTNAAVKKITENEIRLF